jgi:hypothetical protein
VVGKIARGERQGESVSRTRLHKSARHAMVLYVPEFSGTWGVEMEVLFFVFLGEIQIEGLAVQY